jgi:glycosyltransferase involved in cell wall biosynthesis
MLMRKLRIAHVAPLVESVPPKLYGGTERVVSFITEELVDRGHDVTLFASGDSRTKAKLIPVCERSLRLDGNCVDPIAPHITQLQIVQQMSSEFDIIHYHTDYLHYPTSQFATVPHVTTLHGRLDIPELKPLYKVFHDVPVISISQSQRRPLPYANWVGNVYHGIPGSLYKPRFSEGTYLAFVGRMSREKGVDDAIEIAKRSGIPLRIAAKVDKNDKEYFEQEIEHLLDHPLIEFVGEIGESEKKELLGSAMALLFPIRWEEPFGLVMIEAMACGTPVIANRRGSVSEIIEDGTNGIIVSSIEEAVVAVEKVHEISRWNCRQIFDQRFTAEVMAKSYEEVYERCVSTHEQSPVNYQAHELN